ncbi:unnamed protein product [Adineta ricciae]|uniref:LicD/FKTN/FKRP nucleotidyltransferase domain-containing protein n=1 Tax=Adineta ricciae TaxID=249248 RepID=A0A814F7I0_ADIRI|nr:unnamed protein product [Adineta ricciae]
MSGLTSLMISFYELNRSSTFCCSETTLRQRYKHEFQQLLHHRLNQSYEQPSNVSYSMASSLPKLPYFYSLWKTSRLLPRLITPCEHQVYIKLLKTLHDLCESNGIHYMISHGTLLGSYRNHDILPYDDDADVLIPRKDYSRLAELNQLNNETDWEFYLKSSRNMKFYFRKSPPAGRYSWKWPFIGIQFYTETATHIKIKRDISKQFIFPLVLRPIATLWLRAPRNAHKYLNSLMNGHYSKFSIDEKCLLQKYSHRHEAHRYISRAVDCVQLHNTYPFIRRTCDETYCQEHFMLNNQTVLYTLKMLKDQ